MTEEFRRGDRDLVVFLKFMSIPISFVFFMVIITSIMKWFEALL